MLSKWLMGGCVVVPLAIGMWSSAQVNGQGLGGTARTVESSDSRPATRAPGGAGRMPSGAMMGRGMPAMGGMMAGEPPDELTLEDVRLEDEIQQLVARLAEGNPDAAALAQGRKLVAELLDKQFAVRQQRREREITEIEERVARLREALKKRGDAKPQMVERRLNELFSEVEGMGWGEVGGQPGRYGGMYPMGATGMPAGLGRPRPPTRATYESKSPRARLGTPDDDDAVPDNR